jgi:hypothetical protein
MHNHFFDLLFLFIFFYVFYFSFILSFFFAYIYKNKRAIVKTYELHCYYINKNIYPLIIYNTIKIHFIYLIFRYIMRITKKNICCLIKYGALDNHSSWSMVRATMGIYKWIYFIFIYPLNYLSHIYGEFYPQLRPPCIWSIAIHWD